MKSSAYLLLIASLFCGIQCTDVYAQDQVKVGSRVWTKSPIKSEADGSYCYDNDPQNCTKYGRMYTHKAALSVCGEGWALPTDQEWQSLEQHFGMSDILSDSIRIYRGSSEVTAAFNDHFVYAYGGMGRFQGKSYLGKQSFTGFWTASDGPTNKAFAIYRMISKDESGIYSDQAPKAEMKYVLCIKEN